MQEARGGVQGEDGIVSDQGRPDDRRTGERVPGPPEPDLGWKKPLLDGVTRVFDGSVAAAEGTVSEAQVDLLYRQIGQLKVENYFCHDAAVSIPLNIGNVSRAIRRVRSGPRPQA